MWGRSRCRPRSCALVSSLERTHDAARDVMQPAIRHAQGLCRQPICGLHKDAALICRRTSSRPPASVRRIR